MRILIVGGTGMLLDAVRGLLQDGHGVWTLARHAPALEDSRLHPLLVDYADPEALESVLSQVTGRAERPGQPSTPAEGSDHPAMPTQTDRPFDGAIVWAHGSSPHVPEAVSRYVRGPFLHVLGSASADPSRDRTPPTWAGPGYRTVVLGFVRETGGSRWLTHGEISTGVLEAWRTGSPDAVVGTVRPWAARP